ncbi:MAG: helix-turn-helix domain-containing protein [Alistipes senegalensis]|nr:helix-turn-helix domain-containing protein [Alistipes senegalensis]
MILADKIIELRKKAGLSQDELAEQMDVSRQSVSKWEGAQSVPDLNKILKLSEIFEVSTDYLLKDDFEKPAPEISGTLTDDKPLRCVSMEEANRFLAVNEHSALKAALGVALCILSVVPATILSVISDILTETLGTVLMFLMIAGAVGLFISAGADKKPFRYLIKEGIDTAYGVEGMLKEKQAKFSPMHTRDLIIGVVLCILSVIPPTLTGVIFTESGFYNCLGSCVLFLMVAGGVFLIVRASLTKKGFSKLLEEDGFTREKKSKEKENGVIVGSYWLIVTAGYLAYSFITGNWGKSWIVFPVAALLTPIVHNIEKKIKSK